MLAIQNNAGQHGSSGSGFHNQQMMQSNSTGGFRDRMSLSDMAYSGGDRPHSGGDMLALPSNALAMSQTHLQRLPTGFPGTTRDTNGDGFDWDMFGGAQLQLHNKKPGKSSNKPLERIPMRSANYDPGKAAQAEQAARSIVKPTSEDTKTRGLARTEKPLAARIAGHWNKDEVLYSIDHKIEKYAMRHGGTYDLDCMRGVAAEKIRKAPAGVRQRVPDTQSTALFSVGEVVEYFNPAQNGWMLAVIWQTYPGDTKKMTKDRRAKDITGGVRQKELAILDKMRKDEEVGALKLPVEAATDKVLRTGIREYVDYAADEVERFAHVGKANLGVEFDWSGCGDCHDVPTLRRSAVMNRVDGAKSHLVGLGHGSDDMFSGMDFLRDFCKRAPPGDPEPEEVAFQRMKIAARDAVEPDLYRSDTGAPLYEEDDCTSLADSIRMPDFRPEGYRDREWAVDYSVV